MKSKNMLLVVVIVLSISTIILAITTSYYEQRYQLAIKQGAKNFVTALEMTTACSELGNFTSEQIFDKYVDMFVKPKLKEASP